MNVMAMMDEKIDKQGNLEKVRRKSSKMGLRSEPFVQAWAILCRSDKKPT